MNNNQGRRRTRRVRQQRKQKSTQISRILLTICMMALVAVVSIGGTLAWLTDNTTPVVNTFTESDVDITLNEQGAELNDSQTAYEQSFKMVPGTDIEKNPEVTYEANNEAGWLFVKLDKSENFKDYLTYEIESEWKVVSTSDTCDVYYMAHAATLDNPSTDANEAAAVPHGVLKGDKVTVKDNVNKAMMDELIADTGSYPTLTVTAYAIQSANLKDAAGNPLDEDDIAKIWALAQTNGNPTNP